MTRNTPRRRPARPIVAAMVVAAMVAGCAEDSPPAGRPLAGGCATGSVPSRWASTAGYVETTAYGREEGEWLHEVGGVAWTGAEVLVYDAPESRVVALDGDLRPLRSFGGRGGGPGELHPVLTRGMHGPGWRWLSAEGDSLVVFDGTAAHRFSPDGRYRGGAARRATERGAISGEIPAIALAGNALVAASGEYARGDAGGGEAGAWRVLRHTERGSAPVLALRLPSLPERSGGVPFLGPTQARPLFAVAGGCVFATDGASGWLVAAPVEGGPADTLLLDLPAIPLPHVDRDEIARLLGAASRGAAGAYTEPTATMRIAALAADPDGHLWLLPAQDPEHLGKRVEVLRLSPATGTLVRDTLPAFPAAFGAPGVFYARVNDRRSGAAQLVRYEARSPPEGEGG